MSTMRAGRLSTLIFTAAVAATAAAPSLAIAGPATAERTPAS